MRKFIIKTLGCKTNQVESALIAEILINNNFLETNNIKEADYYIINTCSVTHIADKKNLAYIKHAKKENPQIIVVLTGCMAQLNKEELLKNKNIDIILGNYEKNDIAKILNTNKKYSVSNIFSHDVFRYQKLYHTNRTRASVKIQDGCNNRCSYCTIPFARGKNRSNSIENIIEQINLFASEGYFETVLTGIHIGQWGEDFTPKSNLKNLLEEIEETNIKRYRLGSLNPQELTKEFIDFLAESKKFCPHFHLSLQSVCNKTLKEMNRHYSEDEIKELILYINKKFNNVFIGSDIIVGFPNETIEDFNITYKNLKNLELSKIHVFPYSKRKGTIADKMDNQIDTNEKKQRVELVQKVSNNKLQNFLSKNINTENEVIIEKQRDKKTGLLKGITKNYINILIDDEDKYKDTIQKIHIIDFYKDKEKLIAKIVT